MDFLKDIERKKDLASAMLDLLIEIGPRKAENNLLKMARKVTDTISEEVVNHELIDNLTDEQLDAVAVYLEMLLAGFNTFIEEVKSTIKKENPHSSGN